MKKISKNSDNNFSTSSRVSRFDGIDMTRGAAILLVVVGHTWRGLWEGGIIENYSLFIFFDRAIYLFHMPVFFILSGFVFTGRGSSSLRNFLKTRFSRILYPLIIWYYIFIGINILMSPYVNSPYNVDRLFGFPDPFDTHLWFLWALFIIQLISTPLIFAKTRSHVVKFSLLVTIISFIITQGFEYFNIWVNQALYFIPFFFFGVLIKEFKFYDMLLSINPFYLLSFGGAIFITAEIINIYVKSSYYHYIIIAFFASAGFIIIVTGLFIKNNKIIYRYLSIFGKASMAIYLVHIFFTSFSRILLKSIGTQDLWLHVAIGTFLGMLGPLIFKMLATKLSMQRIFSV